MRLYGAKWDSAARLRFGRRFKRGLERVPATRGLAATVEAVQGPLATAAGAREAAEEQLELAADDLAFAELDAEAKARRLMRRAMELDGDRAGPITRVGFPDGLGGVIDPKGQAQLDALVALRKRYAESGDPVVAPAKAELVAIADEAVSAFKAPYETWVAARKVRAEAFEVELIRRDEHRRAMDAVFGGVRSALPQDRALQNAIVPRVTVASSGKAELDEEDDGGGGTGGGGTGGGGTGGGNS